MMEPTRPRHGMPVEEIRSLMSENGLKEAFSKVGKNRFEARYVEVLGTAADRTMWSIGYVGSLSSASFGPLP